MIRIEGFPKLAEGNGKKSERENSVDDPSIAKLREAILALANACDGAKTQDGVGFSRDDAKSGHELAHKVERQESWSTAEIKIGRQFARKYRGQIEGLGFVDLARDLKTLTKEEKQELKPFDVYHVGDPATEPTEEPPPPIVEGLVFPGFILVAGPPKRSYKTLWATYLALCAQGGLDFFGRKTATKKVLIVQRDMGKPWFVRYVRSLRSGMNLPPVPNIPVVSMPMDLKAPEDVERLRKTIETHGAQVIVIDSSRSTSSVEENFSEDVRKITRDLVCDVLRDELKITVILITHVAKQGSGPRGSTEWPASADSILNFEPNQTGGFVKVTAEGRHPAFEFFFRFEGVPNPAGGCPGFRLEEVSDGEVAEVRKQDTQSKLRALALSLWEAEKTLTKTELVAWAKDEHALKAKGTTLNGLLERLKKHFPAIREEVKGRTRHFSITDRAGFGADFKRHFGEELPVPGKGNSRTWEQS